MLKLPLRALTLIGLLGFVAAPVHAAGPGEIARGLAPSLQASFIREHAPTLAPFAHVRFCLKNPEDCKVSQTGATVEATADMEARLFELNRTINKRIKQINDSSADFGDSWKVALNAGDCEDIALAKRKALISAGWPARAVRLAVTRTVRGEGHAVLVVRTSRGDLVLDNRSNVIKVWKATDLTWLKIQSADNPRIWMTI